MNSIKAEDFEGNVVFFTKLEDHASYSKIIDFIIELYRFAEEERYLEVWLDNVLYEYHMEWYNIVEESSTFYGDEIVETSERIIYSFE